MTKATTTKRAPNQTSWKPGQSGNAAGRPRSGLAFAEAARRRIDPDVVLDLVVRCLADEDVPIAQRLMTVLPFVHAGYLKPPVTTDLNVNGSGAPVRDFGAMSIDERRELLGRLRAVPEVTGRAVDAAPTSTPNTEPDQQVASATNASPMRRDHDHDDQAT